MDRSGKTKMNSTMINTAVVAIVAVVILFSAFASIMPEVQEAGDSFNETGTCANAGGFYNASVGDCTNSRDDPTILEYDPIPLAGLFGSGGAAVLLIMAALIIMVAGAYLKKRRK